MEFKSLKNIETSFKQIRLFGILYLYACVPGLWVMPFGTRTVLQKNSVKRFTFSMGVNPLCWHFRRTYHRIVPWKQRNTFGVSTNSFLPCRRIRTPLNRTYSVPYTWRIKVLSITIRTYPKRGIITVSFPGTSTSRYRWTV